MIIESLQVLLIGTAAIFIVMGVIFVALRALQFLTREKNKPAAED